MSSKFHLSKWKTYFSQFIDKFLKTELRESGTDYSRKNLRGLIKNEVEFPRSTKKNNVEFPGVFVFGIGNSQGCNTVPRIIQGLSFVLSGIFGGKVKKWKVPREVSKKYIFNPLFGFFSRIAQYLIRYVKFNMWPALF